MYSTLCKYLPSRSFVEALGSVKGIFRSGRWSSDRLPPTSAPKYGEEDLFQYTRQRWIYNEAQQRSQHYLKFDVGQLVKAALDAVETTGAKSCTQILKCREGLNNKAMLLTMDNGTEVLAKLPSPSAGPPSFTTASEVATRTFIREVLDIPTPRILAWSSDSSNPVGAEYIIEEKAAGQPLGSLWYRWPMKDRTALIQEIVDMERKLTDLSFEYSGCIYFNDGRQKGVPMSTSPPLPPSANGRFVIGPLVTDRLWQGNRASMDLDRGPFHRPIDYAEAMATNELKYVKKYGHPRMNYHRSSTEPQLPEEALSLLERYLQVVQCMEPPRVLEDTHSARLWHPDLHLDNIFVDAVTKQITNIIDWQGATVMPLYYQCGVPAGFTHSGPVSDKWAISVLPKNYYSLSEEEKSTIDAQRRSEMCHKYYQSVTKTNNPVHWAAMHLDHLEVRVMPTHYAVEVWEDQHLYFFRKWLMEIAERWEELCPTCGPCPISFTDKELALQLVETKNTETILGIIVDFLLNWGVMKDGRVEATDFDQTLVAINEQRENFINTAKDADERLLFERLWPYQDGDRHGPVETKLDYD